MKRTKIISNRQREGNIAEYWVGMHLLLRVERLPPLVKKKKKPL